MVGVVMGGFGRVDVLVNNAGISHISPVEEITLVDWRSGDKPYENIPHVPRARKKVAGARLREHSEPQLRRGLLGVAERAAYNAS